MTMKKISFFLSVLLITCLAYSTNNIDSLENVIENTENDSIKAEILLQISYLYLQTDNIKANDYAEKAKKIFEKRNSKKGLAFYYYIQGLINKRNYQKALLNYENALRLFKDLKSKLWTAIISAQIASTYSSIYQYEKAIEMHLKAIDIFTSINDKQNIAICYSDMASIYANQKNYKMALEYHKKSLRITNDKINENDYLNIATDYSEMGDYKSALLYYDSIFAILAKKPNIQLATIAYQNQGVTYLHLKNYNKSEQCLKTAIALAKESENNNNLLSATLNLAELYNKINRSNEAVTLLEERLQLLKNTNDISIMTEYYKNMAAAYEKVGRTHTALEYYKLYKASSDSLNKNLSNQRLLELQTTYEVNQKDQKIELLNKDNMVKASKLYTQRILMILILISTLFAVAIAIILFNRFRLKRKMVDELDIKNKEIEQQKQEILAVNDMLASQNEELQELDRMKSRFFTNISHEFRTPLSLIIGPIASLREKNRDGQIISVYNNVLNQSYRLLNLINQLLELSKLKKASLKLKLTNDDINQYLKQLVESIAFDEKTSRMISYKSAPNPLIAVFDKDIVDKIVTNLLSNALKHVNEQGKIEVILTQPDENKEYLEIEIKDNGSGIAPNELKKIFEPFYQAEEDVKRKVEGFGIGLALVKELVELHGGAITVVSKPSEGTSFNVKLAVTEKLLPNSEWLTNNEVINNSQLVNNNTEIADENTIQKEPRIIKDRVTILVVEDNEDMRTFISNNLLEEYQVVQAENGKKGLEKVLEINPDLVITDVMMPDMDGYELTKIIKTDPRISHIPVIILTAKASEDDKIEGLELAADDYVTKPFNIKELLLRIRNTIANRQKLREKYQKSITVNPSEVTATSLDEQFLTKALDIIENHLSESDYNVDDFCIEIGISKTHLYRKLKALTNQSYTEFVRTIRLKRAASLLKQKAGNLTEIAYQTGFTNLSYFSRSFKDEFGVSPSEYITN